MQDHERQLEMHPRRWKETDVQGLELTSTSNPAGGSSNDAGRVVRLRKCLEGSTEEDSLIKGDDGGLLLRKRQDLSLGNFEFLISI